MTTQFELSSDPLAAVSLFAPKKDIRYYLNGVFLEIYSDRVIAVATNGYYEAAYRERLPVPLDIEKPIGVIVPLELLPKLPKGSMVSITVGDATAQPRVRQLTIATGKHPTLTGQSVDGSYPDWRRAIPEKTSGEPAEYGPDPMAVISAAAKRLGAGGLDYAFSYNGSGPAIVTFTGKAAEACGFLAVVAPLRERKFAAPASAPIWINFATAAATE